MKKITSFFILIAIVTTTIYAQDEVWYFGYGKAGSNWWPEGGNGLSFTGAGFTPAGNNTSGFGFYESSTVVSDGSGNVLFYSDGLKIYNKNHLLMQNGGGLLGPQEDNTLNSSGSSANGVFSTFDPGGDPNKYFVFTINDIVNNVRNGFRYNVIDMAANGGLGSVTSKNQTILAGSTRTEEFMGMSASPCSDTTWIVVHGGGNNNFYAVPLTPTGVQISQMVTSSVGPVVNNSGQGRGSFSFNSDGTKLAMAGRQGLGGWIFDFDPYTGIVSNPLQASNKPGHYGCAWSPDDQNVYFTSGSVGTGTEFVHFNTTLPVSVTNPSTIYNGALGQGAIELGKDGKLYIGRWDWEGGSGNTSLSIINTPNAPNAASCGWVLNGYNPGVGGTPYMGLPKMYFKTTNTGGTKATITNPTKDTTICDTTSSFKFLATPSGGTFTSSAPGAILPDGTFNAAAAITAVGDGFTLDIIYDGNCITPDTVTITMISCCPPVAILTPTATCAENPVDLAALVVSGLGTWTVSPITAGIITGNVTFTPTPGTSAIYTLTYTLNSPSVGCTNDASVTLTVNSPSPVIANDIALICIGSGTDMILSGTPSGGTWTGGGSNPLSVNSGGTYTYTITDADGCIDSAQYLADSDLQPIVSLANTSICPSNGSTTLDATTLVGTDTYAWSDASTNPTLLVTSPGIYWVDVTSVKGCVERATSTIDNFPVIPVTISSTSNVICTGSGNIVTISGSPTGGAWSDTGAESHTISVPDTYTYTLVDANKCSFSESITISNENAPTLSLNDITVCTDAWQTIETSTGKAGDSYLWDDGSTNSTKTLSSEGEIWVRITSANNCISSDTMLVSTSTPPSVALPANDSICTLRDSTLLVAVTHNAAASSTITWNTLGSENDPDVTVIETPTTIIVTVTDPDGCAGKDTMEVIEYCVPAVIETVNIFIPGGSDNPTWTPTGTYTPADVGESHFEVYNRWGLKMFETTARIPSWDGTNNGAPCTTGVYFWIWKYTEVLKNEKHNLNGYVQLLQKK